DQAEQVVVGLGHGLRRPVLVHGADLELLEVAAVRVRAAGLSGGLIGLDPRRRLLLGHVFGLSFALPESRESYHRRPAITRTAPGRRGAADRHHAAAAGTAGTSGREGPPGRAPASRLRRGTRG